MPGQTDGRTDGTDRPGPIPMFLNSAIAEWGIIRFMSPKVEIIRSYFTSFSSVLLKANQDGKVSIFFHLLVVPHPHSFLRFGKILHMKSTVNYYDFNRRFCYIEVRENTTHNV